MQGDRKLKWTSAALSLAGLATFAVLLSADAFAAAKFVGRMSIEVQEEKARLVQLAISAALVSALLIISLVLMAIVVLACYWDTPDRVSAALVLAGTFGALTAVCGFYLAAQLRRSTTLFSTSASELRRDAAALAEAVPPQ